MGFGEWLMSVGRAARVHGLRVWMSVLTLLATVAAFAQTTPLDGVINSVKTESEGMVVAIVGGVASVILLVIGVRYLINTIARRAKSA